MAGREPTDIADHLGMTFETVSREMTKLRDLQIIDLLGLRKFKIQRPGVLQSLALTGHLGAKPCSSRSGTIQSRRENSRMARVPMLAELGQIGLH